MPPPRMTANPKRPTRYRPGKGQDESSSEYETEEEETKEQKVKSRSKPTASTTNKVTGAFQEVTLSAQKLPTVVNQAPIINEDEFETESEDEDDKGQGTAAKGGRLKQESSDDDEEDDDDDDDEYDESSEEEEDETESSSEDEQPAKLLRPTFIRKNQRPSTNATLDKAQSEAQIAAEAEIRRKAKADALVQEQLERNAQLKANEKKAWDDSDHDGVEGKTEAEVDDTDDLDPEAERAAWKLRELRRVKRAREQIELAEKEREEIERRRNLSKEEREAEDAAHLADQEEDREGKGKAGYMQRYFHKGAFFQDSAYAEEAGLKGRDIMGSKFADQVNNREMLPEFMQIRDMAKLGRKGRTKYRDLKAEDTGRWGDFGRPNHRQRDDAAGPGATGEILDERFRPDDDRDRRGPSGANATAVRNGSRERDRRKRSASPVEARQKSRDGEHRHDSRFEKRVKVGSV